ncbi:hypothetical protein OIU85_005616 [Salix viminalis]|uniref:Plastid lipid-associated protein/fibrillin conserved domain-containing protein n=1 Tax=Salix viminalis TaxID=40686 RepID=A0A9Q0PJ77_SALVM|nr:hypothetical protein OIU85_005616 [Salix viminalis]
MAPVSSPLHPPVFSFSPSPPPSAKCKLPSKVHTVHRISPIPHETRTGRDGSYTHHRQRSVVLRSALDEIYVLDPPPSSPYEEGKTESIASLKLTLLSVVSGLNRGLAASEDDQQKADAAAKDLEAAGGLVDLSKDIDKLQGRWKLIYSSAFSSRTLGGSRPGPPTGRLLPITLGQVFQRIDVLSKDFDNIVELELGSSMAPTTGNLSQLPPLEVPQIPDALRPPSNTGSGEFEVTYLDAETRVTRGDRSELRVFVLS